MLLIAVYPFIILAKLNLQETLRLIWFFNIYDTKLWISQLGSCVSVRWCFIELVWWLKSKTFSSFLGRNQNFITSFQYIDTFHQFTIASVLTDRAYLLYVTVCLINIFYLTLFVENNYMMPWPLHCNVRSGFTKNYGIMKKYTIENNHQREKICLLFSF